MDYPLHNVASISPNREGNQKILIQMLLTLSSLLRFSRVIRDDSSFVRCLLTISTDFKMFVFQTVVSFFSLPASPTNRSLELFRLLCSK